VDLKVTTVANRRKLLGALWLGMICSLKCIVWIDKHYYDYINYITPSSITSSSQT